MIKRSHWMCFRIPLHRMRSVRRTLVDSVLTQDQLKSWVEKGGDAAWCTGAAQCPVEKLSNFMDVSSSSSSSTSVKTSRLLR